MRVRKILPAIFLFTSLFASAQDAKPDATPIDPAAIITKGRWLFQASWWKAYHVFKADKTFTTSGMSDHGIWSIEGQKLVLTFASDGHKDSLDLPLDPKGTHGTSHRGDAITATQDTAWAGNTTPPSGGRSTVAAAPVPTPNPNSIFKNKHVLYIISKGDLREAQQVRVEAFREAGYDVMIASDADISTTHYNMVVITATPQLSDGFLSIKQDIRGEAQINVALLNNKYDVVIQSQASLRLYPRSTLRKLLDAKAVMVFETEDVQLTTKYLPDLAKLDDPTQWPTGDEVNISKEFFEHYVQRDGNLINFENDADPGQPYPDKKNEEKFFKEKVLPKIKDALVEKYPFNTPP